MARFHLKDDGIPGVCTAQPGNCPKQDESEHYESFEEAKKASEQKYADQFQEAFRGKRKIQVPTVSKAGLSHVGTLAKEHKKSFSYEGQGLSISEHPDEWRAIARLSGETHHFEKSAKLLDFHELSAEAREDIIAYALEKGWIESTPLYRVSRYDDEWDQEFFTEYTSYEEASENADDPEEEIETVQGYRYGNLNDSTIKPGDPMSLDIVVAAWVNEERADLDGVWWEDEFEPNLLSAPRGVIVPNKIDSWLRG